MSSVMQIDYRRKNWNRQPELESSTILYAFNFVLMPEKKELSHLFYSHGVNNWADWVL